MTVDKLLIIPQIDEIDQYLELTKKYHCGFEYNDFFIPVNLDKDGFIEDRISQYEQQKDLPDFCTMHGSFLDVTLFSDDSKIVDVSNMRIEQSIMIAKKIGCKSVVFHTNYIANFKAPFYRKNWLDRNIIYWKQKCKSNPDITILIENMFDDTPQLLALLGEAMKEVPNFGICFDYAHAHVFGDETKIDEWVMALAPYVKHIHINDNDFLDDSHMALGDGKINWILFKQNVEKYFKNASILIEVTGIDKIKKSLEFLKNL